MKGLIYSGLSALLLTTATGVILPATNSAQAQMRLNINAPIITDSGVLGRSHFIRVSVIGMSLEDLMIALPEQMEKFEGVRVTEQSGKEVPAEITINPDKVAINFAQPVTPNTDLKIELTDVQMRKPGGETLLYRLTAQRVGLRGQIPIGTALVYIIPRD